MADYYAQLTQTLIPLEFDETDTLDGQGSYTTSGSILSLHDASWLDRPVVLTNPTTGYNYTVYYDNTTLEGLKSKDPLGNKIGVLDHGYVTSYTTTGGVDEVRTKTTLYYKISDSLSKILLSDTRPENGPAITVGPVHQIQNSAGKISDTLLPGFDYSSSYWVDLGPAVAPDVSVDGVVGMADATTPIVTGSVYSFDTTSVELYAGDTDLGAAVVNQAAGTWVFSADIGAGDFSNIRAVATNSVGLSASADARAEIVAGIEGESFAAQVFRYQYDGTLHDATNYDAAGHAVSKTETLAGNTHSITALVQRQTLTSVHNDEMSGPGATRFVFVPGFGQDDIHGFHLAGRTHDTIDLSNTRLSSLGQVLQRTSMSSSGNAVIHLNQHDTIELVGVTKKQIAAHRQDFAFG